MFIPSLKFAKEKGRETLKSNELILQTITKLVVFIILTLAFYLFFSGHNAPGGGFVGGLILASAIILLFLAFDIETVLRSLPIDFKLVAAIGVFLAVGTGLGSFIFQVPFLSQTILLLNVPWFGTVELSTVTIFELGVALTVVGTVVTIILTISEDV